MTTIAYRDGILSFDSLATADGCRIGNILKGIATDKYLVAIAGDAWVIPIVFAWARAGFTVRTKPKFKAQTDFEAVIIDRQGSIRIFGADLAMLPMEGTMYAAGSGAIAALGAMYAGCTARQAVAAGIKVDIYSGGPVRSVTFVKE